MVRNSLGHSDKDKKRGELHVYLISSFLLILEAGRCEAQQNIIMKIIEKWKHVMRGQPGVRVRIFLQGLTRDLAHLLFLQLIAKHITVRRVVITVDHNHHSTTVESVPTNTTVKHHQQGHLVVGVCSRPCATGG